MLIKRLYQQFIRRPNLILPLLAAVGVMWFYIWTATSSCAPIHLGEKQVDYYNLLADGLLDGQLSLKVTPPLELLKLPDPFDPVANEKYKLHDVSLYNGRYYLYFGITPALAFVIPWRYLTGSAPPQSLTLLFFTLGGLFWSLLTLRLLLKRFEPGASPLTYILGIIAIEIGRAHV